MNTEFWSALAEQIVSRFQTNLSAIVIVLLFILVGWILAYFVSRLVKRFINHSRLNHVYENSRLAQELDKVRPGRSLADLVGRATFWMIWLYIDFTGITVSGLNLESTVLISILDFLPRLFIAFLILVGGVMLAQLVGNWVQVSVAATGAEYDEILGKGARLLLITIVVITTIEELGIDLSPITNALTNIITIAVAGLALAFGIGARDVVGNILAGYYAREYFNLGDHIQINDVSGTLISIGTVSTEIGFDGNSLVIANSELNRKTTKLSRSHKSND
jgi:small-conductance mechanosensitive channel